MIITATLVLVEINYKVKKILKIPQMMLYIDHWFKKNKLITIALIIRFFDAIVIITY